MSGSRTIEIPSARFGRYRIRSRLGAGGMAEVFLAEVVDESGQEQSVAVKLMREGVSEESFAGEADLMGILSHPNIVSLLEVGTAFGRPFIAMEYLLGGDLREVMAAHRRQRVEFPLRMALHVLIEVLKALAYFHGARTRSGLPLKLIHGDVNPANIFFSSRGEVKLGDFGVAKSAAVNLGPREGVAAGKLHYLSPEQTQGEPLAPASDLFALGVVMHELVVGYHPFLREETDPQRVMAAIRQGKLTLPEQVVEPPLAQVLRRALSPDLRHRYASAGEFAGDLFRYALDQSLLPSAAEVQEWLEGVLGILV